MELYNCEEQNELDLQEIELELLTDSALKNISDNIIYMYNEQELEDETIVISALHQIIREQGARIEEYYKIAKGTF